MLNKLNDSSSLLFDMNYNKYFIFNNPPNKFNMANSWVFMQT